MCHDTAMLYFDFLNYIEKHLIFEPLLATENDVLNGIVMLFGRFLTNIDQMFEDVSTY